MTARTATATALAAIALTASAACSTSGEATDAPPAAAGLTPLSATATAPQPTSAPFADSASLAAAMITVSDLPLGYTVLDLPPADSDPNAGDSSEDRSGTDPAACAGVLASVASQYPGSVADASVTFSGPDFSSVDQDAASYPAGGAPMAFEAVQNTLRDCGSFSGTDAVGVHVDYAVGALPDDDSAGVGDASVTFTVRTTSEGLTLVSDAVVAVVGSTVVQLVATGQDSADPVLLHDLADTAVDRLRGVQGP